MLKLLWPIWISSAAFAQTAWDVTNTGEPFTEATFTVSEGTWMSVDVSPDGATLVFDLLGDIYRLPAEGGDAVLVHGGPAMQHSPTFSRDGERILYLSDASGDDNLWTSRPDGADARQITNETVDVPTGPGWGPDDDSVVAARIVSTFGAMYSSELRLFDIEGGAGRVLVETPGSGRDVEEARFSRDGRFLYYTERVLSPKFVYVDANHINYVLNRRDMETGATEEILRGFGGATSAEISPDGSRVAFVRRVGAKTVLFSYDTESRAERPVYDGLARDLHADFVPQGSYYPGYGWFPDNRRVAIWGKGKLFKVDMTTGESREIPFLSRARHRITVAPRFERDPSPERFTVRAIRNIAPAPDGTRLVFGALGRLWRMDLPSGTPARLTTGRTLEFDPTYSADGRALAYVEWDDERGSALKVMAGGGAISTVAENAGVIREPAFSRDGSRLAYRIRKGSEGMGGHRGRPGIFWAPAGGGESRYVTAEGEAPQFSPDGQRLFYTVSDRSGGGEVHRLKSVNLDGFDEREHARTEDADTFELRLSPDARWIAFRSRQQYYALRYRETGVPLTVTSGGSAVPVAALSELGGYALTWSPDSTTVTWALGPDLYRAPIADRFTHAVGRVEPFASIDLEVSFDAPEGSVAFTNGRVITMRGEEVLERATVLITGNRIAAIGPRETLVLPRDATVIDVAGKTLMPGLIDMHGHIDCCFGLGVVPQKQGTLYAALAFGVTTNFDPYSSELTSYETGESIAAGLTVGPRWIGSGSVIYGRAEKPDATYVPIQSLLDARAVMARKRALGAFVIKSYKQPMRRQRQQLVKAGRESGILVDVEGESHFQNNVSMVLDGHTNLEHNLPIATYYDDVVQLMAHGTTAHTPTLIVSFGELFGENYLYQTTRLWDDPKVRAYVRKTTSSYSPLDTPSAAPPYVRGMTTIHAADEMWDIGFRSVARSIKKLDDAGVTVHAGSHGQIAGLAMHWEMWLLAEGGMANARILRAATLNGAKTLGLDKHLGSLEPGKLADLIVLDENPLDDIRNTNTVRYTMVNGRLYDSLSMNEIGNHPRPRGRFYWEER